jgi:chromosomal replication initiator protein
MEPVSNPPAAEHATQEVGREDEHVEGRASAATGASSHPWDGYLTGPENELAMAAAQGMARGEREGISPLVVHGPSGVGKSRLLAGLVAEWLRRQPGRSVAHLDAQDFGSACLAAAGEAAGAGWSALRARLRCVELFVLEDLEGLERAPLARDELAHTLDALDATGAAVAVSARSAPGTWPRLEWPVRLINRLLGGLAARIAPPGLTSRRRYVLQHAAQHGVALQAEAVEMLAQAADGYRPLDGWIARLALEDRLNRAQEGKEGAQGRATARGGQRPRSHLCRGSAALDPHTVATILAEETLLADPLVTIDAIAQAVAARFRVRLDMLRGPSRRASVVAVRHLAMHLARTHAGSSFPAIGIYFGGRDPATVRHACKAASQRLSADPTLAAAVATLSQGWQMTDA